MTSPDPLEATLRELSEATEQPCWILDLEARLHHANPAFSRRAGLPAEEAAGMGWMRALSPADREPGAPWRQRLGEEASSLELRVGSQTWPVRAVPLRDGTRRWMLVAQLWSYDLAEQARSFAELGDDLLDVARVARGQSELHKERLALSGLVQGALRAWRGPGAPPRVDIEDELQVDVDEHRLRRALLHLLTSASRLASPGALCLSAERSAGELLIRLQGAPFLGRPQGELDMSLSLIRSLAELHGGRVEVHASQLLLGLPEVSHRAQRILVVEDNEDAAYLLSVLLESAGHEVRVANDPHAALALTETFLPDVAILDIGLPVMDGYELGSRLLAKLRPHSPQLIALSGYGQQHDRQRSADAGFGVHLVKPVDPDHLLGMVSRLA